MIVKMVLSRSMLLALNLLNLLVNDHLIILGRIGVLRRIRGQVSAVISYYLLVELLWLAACAVVKLLLFLLLCLIL